MTAFAARKMVPLKIDGDEWAGKIQVICGNGMSALDVDWRQLEERDDLRVCVTNGGFRTVPWAHTLMLSDRHFLAEIKDWSPYKGPEMVVTQPRAAAAYDPRMKSIRRGFIEHCTGDPYADRRILYEGHNSITTLISLAVHRGCRKILLIGVDLTPGAGGRRRATDSSIDDPAAAQRRYERQQKHFDMFKPWLRKHGVEVLNGNPSSHLATWPKTGFADGLRLLAA